ncbi:hypothetical protein EDM56_15380 [Brevibacillus fluminis]|uniref:Uncharacterized protein n=1 Tax=Brevibacillus fluminis TaxID=511487 RepID=A0A3M8DI77_9BACL|nr:hypothetical protein EDM56_15380 [Brevibacillus fluminis]
MVEGPGFSEKSSSALLRCLLGAGGDRLRAKMETAPQRHTLRGGCISGMICDAKDVSIFALRLAGIVKAPLRFFPKIPWLLRRHSFNIMGE